MRPQFFFLAPALVSLAVVMSACGASDDPVTYKYPTYEDFCTARAQAECSETVQTRCTADAKSCVDKRTSACLTEKRSDASYQPAAADDCLSKVSSAYSDDQVTPEELHDMAEACEHLFSGSRAVGQTCQAPYQCAPDGGATCVIPNGKTDGTCQVPVPKEAGDACGPADSVCAEGLFCTSSEPHVCAKRYDVGQACSRSLLCKETLSCALASDDSGTCQEKAGIGSACHGDADCASDLCATVRICQGDDCQVKQQCVGAIILTPSDPFCEQFR